MSLAERIETDREVLGREANECVNFSNSMHTPGNHKINTGVFVTFFFVCLQILVLCKSNTHTYTQRTIDAYVC